MSARRRWRPDSAFTRLFVAFAVVAIGMHFTAWLLFRLLVTGPKAPLVGGLPLAITLQAIWLAITAGIGARFLSKPISRLAEGAARLGADLRSPPLAEEGPAEARQAAQVFNQMQEQILRQVDERSRFLAAVSHDLRTPLARMRLRLSQAELPAAQRDKLLADVNEMAALVNETLDYLRGDDRGEPLRVTDLVALVEALVDDLREEGADIACEGQAAPLAVRSAALRRCLSNLATNAIRYGGVCRIRLRETDGQVQIDVEDHGPGIPENQLEAVLQPFRRLDESRNRALGGVGLGLAIASDIARSHGGSLSLRNRPEGGLLARVVLPR